MKGKCYSGGTDLSLVSAFHSVLSFFISFSDSKAMQTSLKYIQYFRVAVFFREGGVIQNVKSVSSVKCWEVVGRFMQNLSAPLILIIKSRTGSLFLFIIKYLIFMSLRILFFLTTSHENIKSPLQNQSTQLHSPRDKSFT